MASKTKQAIDWINGAPGRTQYAAARMWGVSQSALSVAMQRQTRALDMWDKWGAAITEAEQTGDKSALIGLSNADHSSAMRGRALSDKVPASIDGRLEYAVSPAARANDWLTVNNKTVNDAARMCELTTASIYGARTAEKEHLAAYERIGAEEVERIAAWVKSHPLRTPADVAQWFDLPIKRIRNALTMRATLLRRAAMRPDATEYDAGRAEGVEAGVRIGRSGMRMQAATLARTVGGEAGEAIAQAIESIQ